MTTEELFQAFPAASRKKRMNREPKTNISAPLSLNVPTNMRRVKRPHMKRYAASEEERVNETTCVMLKSTITANDSQKRP